MTNTTEVEYVLAMQVLEELCTAQRIKVNDKLRELFWQGVVHGWNRAGGKSGRRDREEHKPAKPSTALSGLSRDYQVGSSVGLSDSASRNRDDLSQGGVFRI